MQGRAKRVLCSLILLALFLGVSPNIRAKAAVTSAKDVFLSDSGANNCVFDLRVVHNFMDYYMVVEFEDGTLAGLMYSNSDTDGNAIITPYHLNDNKDDIVINKIPTINKDNLEKYCYKFEKSADDEIYRITSVNFTGAGYEKAKTIYLYDLNGDLLFSCSREDITSTTETNDVKYVPQEPKDDDVKIKDIKYSEDGKTAEVTIVWDFEESQKHYKDDADANYAQGALIYGKSFDTPYQVEINKDNCVKGEVVVEVKANGKYTLVLQSNFTQYTREFEVDGVKETIETSNAKYPPATNKKVGSKAKVSFKGIPKSIERGDSFKLSMLTDKKCVRKFGGRSNEGNKYVVTSDFVITHNGTYSYTAKTASGAVTKGKLKITCFVDPSDINPNDYQYTGDPTNPTSPTLPQTGSLAWWVIMLTGFTMMSVGLVLMNSRNGFILNVLNKMRGGIHK